MKILGIDYGRSKVGLAVGISGFAEPLKVIKYKDPGVLTAEIKKIVEAEGIEKMVVGVSEAGMGAESKQFADSLGAVTFDETLTSKDAQRLSIEASIGRKKRHEMEDAYAAAVMLQNYLDGMSS
jgi:RNase H-fold protein (predicted Holliday junction resolvase)